LTEKIRVWQKRTTDILPMSITIAELYCYPIKSCRGCTLRTTEIGRMGVRFDRQWLVVDDTGMFVAQRSAAGMASASVRYA